MKPPSQHPRGRLAPGRRAAFTLVEAGFCTVLVGGLVVVALDALRSSVVAQQGSADSVRWKVLANHLMTEILAHPYEDPDGSALFGLELTEVLATRASFDDVDDYDGLWESPPCHKDGTPISGFQGWTWSVVVKFADPTDLTKNKLADSGVKRVKVTVSRSGVTVGSLSSVRSGNPSGAPLVNIN